MEYLHTGCCSLSPSTLLGVVCIAEYLELLDLEQACFEMIHGSVDFKSVFPPPLRSRLREVESPWRRLEAVSTGRRARETKRNVICFFSLFFYTSSLTWKNVCAISSIALCWIVRRNCSMAFRNCSYWLWTGCSSWISRSPSVNKCRICFTFS